MLLSSLNRTKRTFDNDKFLVGTRYNNYKFRSRPLELGIKGGVLLKIHDGRIKNSLGLFAFFTTIHTYTRMVDY